MTYGQTTATYFSSRGGDAALPLPVETPPAEAFVGWVADPWLPAAGAREYPVTLLDVERARAWGLGAVLTEDLVLLGCQRVAPL